MRILLSTMVLGGVLATGLVGAQSHDAWVYFQGDQAGTRYSTLTRISAENMTMLERAWTFHTKPQPGNPDLDTWFGDDATTVEGPGVWGVFTADAERGILYVPVEKVGNNYYGGSHHGNR